MTRFVFIIAGAIAAAVFIAVLGTVAQAQQRGSGPPNALQGFSQNRDQPVQIEAATLEVREKEKQATFSGNVKVTQGDTGLRAKSLVVFYEDNRDTGDSKPDNKGGNKNANKGQMTQANPGPNGQQQIKRLEAKGGVIVTQKDQTVTGDIGVFDMRTNTVTMSGNVVMTQGQNVLRGDRLMVDLGTGVSRVESGKSGNGRVQGLFHAGGGKPGEGVLPSIPAPGTRQPSR